MYQCSLENMTEKIQTFATFGATGNGGVTRYSLSKEAVMAREEFEKRMRKIGASIEIDDVGNIYATIAGEDADAKRIAMGSHVDSVLNGGNYDGILGVLSAMEVLETIVREKIPHKHPLTAVIWTNEEGSLYEPSMMCSGIVCYDYLPPQIQEKYHFEDMMDSKSIVDNKTTFGEALKRSGYQGDKKYRMTPEKYESIFETHIEQGPILEEHHKDIGVVDYVIGLMNYRVILRGQTVHSGTFPMERRKDAFYAASQVLCSLHEQIDALHIPGLVYTTGEVVCHPCIHTCVPDYFEFSFDARHKDPKYLKKVLEILKDCTKKEWSGCSCEIQEAWTRETVYWNQTLVSYVEKAARDLGVSYQYIHSGAGHDAQYLGYMLPTTMIFVQSKGGLSHCEEEYSSPEQCTEGASVMLNAVLMADMAEEL